MNFTQKESNFLQELKKEEETCIQKYGKYSQEASDPNLKTLFSQLGQKEQQHLNSINQIISGTVPNINQNQMAQGQNQSSQQSMSNQQSSGASNSNDGYLCTDALSTEKHVSSNYNTSIFEFKNKDVRNVLNHIQKEEQEHGEQIYNYMAQNNLYQA